LFLVTPLLVAAVFFGISSPGSAQKKNDVSGKLATDQELSCLGLGHGKEFDGWEKISADAAKGSADLEKLVKQFGPDVGILRDRKQAREPVIGVISRTELTDAGLQTQGERITRRPVYRLR
jgi:hypothetical protein